MHAYPGFFISLCLIVITGLAFAPVRHNAFVGYDDDIYVSDNPHLLGGLTWENVRWAFSANLTEASPNADYWIPATFLSHLLVVQLFGMDPAAHHLVNAALHALNAVLLFLALRRLTGAMWPSAFVAALFAVHPLHVESVAWVSERKDVLSGLFFMLMLLAYARYVESPTTGRYLWIVVALALGLMAKPMLVTSPFILLLLDYWPLGRFPLMGGAAGSRWRTAWTLVWEKGPLWLLAAGSMAITYLATHGRGSVLSLEEVSLPARFGNALVAYASYIGLLSWPHNLAVFYPHPGTTLPMWQVAGAAVLLMVITALVMMMGRQRPYLPVGWFWYLGALLPVIGLVQVGGQAMADRYAYLPLTGLFIMIAWGGSELTASWRYRTALLSCITVVVVSLLMAVARLQVSYWRNSVTLFEHTIRVTARNYVAHYNLGNVLVRQGRVAEAIDQYSEALRIKPADAMIHNNLGLALVQQGRLEEAVNQYHEALRLLPDYWDAHFNLGLALVQQGRMTEAIDQYSEALRIKPDSEKVHNNLGVALAKEGRFEEAVSHFSQALRIRPDYEMARRNLNAARLQHRQ